MATATQNPESALVTALGILHPDYTVELVKPVNEVYPVLLVTNGKKYINTQIRLAENHWTVKVLDRLVEKMIKRIEATEVRK